MNYLWSPWRMEYIQSKKSEVCVFCTAVSQPDGVQNLIVYRGRLAFLILNRYPYTSGHLMVVPFDHRSSLAQLDASTRAEMMEIANQALQVLGEIYQPEGYNLGINIGGAAGAGITEHVHMHVLPRWGGDTNFMSSVANTRVLPESLDDTYQRVKDIWWARKL